MVVITLLANRVLKKDLVERFFISSALAPAKQALLASGL
jgi:hypothetical protein